MNNQEEELRVYKIRLENTIRRLENHNLNEKEIEAYNERLEFYTKFNLVH